MLGWHRLWALKRRLIIPVSAIVSARHDPAAARGAKGLKWPGTHVPGYFAAGSFRRGGQWTFWDVRDPERAIVVELRGQRYDRLVVEVQDPKESVQLLNEAASNA